MAAHLLRTFIKTLFIKAVFCQFIFINPIYQSQSQYLYRRVLIN